MHEEQLFEMVNQAILSAKEKLESNQEFTPFAMLLYRNGFIDTVRIEEENHEVNYDRLVETLRTQIADAPKITGVAIVATVTIPGQYKAPVESGIRIHLEERHKSDDKIGGRFLYVPYQLIKQASTEKIEAHLYNPIPVGIPQEIFKSN